MYDDDMKCVCLRCGHCRLTRLLTIRAPIHVKTLPRFVAKSYAGGFPAIVEGISEAVLP